MHTATPSGEEYAMLAGMAREYRDEHLVALKSMAGYNPHLGVDALCFQRLSEAGGAALLAGALITPSALWLVALPAEASVANDHVLNSHVLSLPSGDYRLERYAFGQQVWYQRRILDDLSELGSMQEAARLAQQLMARLMQPAVDDT